MSSSKQDATSFEARYPNVAGWVLDGWIELGPRDWSGWFIRVMDEGGLVWQGQRSYARVDEAIAEADQAIEAWHKGEL